MSHLSSVVWYEVDRSTVTGLESSGQVFPRQTVSSELVSLAAGGLLSQPGKLLAHLHLLHSGQREVALSAQN